MTGSNFPILPTLLVMIAPLIGCGSGETLVSISVTPSSATANSITGSNTVQFMAMGNYAPTYCGSAYAPPCTVDHTQPLKNATWSTSDGTNTAVDAKGLATCASPTIAPAKIIASAQGANGMVSGSARLTCN